MVRFLLALFTLVVATTASVAVASACADDGCADGCADDAERAAEAAQEHSQEHSQENTQEQPEDDACGDAPCPCDGDDRDCPPNCHDCGCSGIAMSTVAPSIVLTIGRAPVATRVVEPPLERRASGVMSRVFRPPRA